MSETDPRFPLRWPDGWPRARSRGSAAFGKRGANGWKQSASVFDAFGRLQAQLDLLGAQRAVLSSNVPLRLDGAPRSDRGEPSDTGAAVYFRLKGRDVALACDKWTRTADNIIALAKHIEALRGQERWGVGTIDQAFRGYEALPAPEQPWQVLGVEPNANRDQINAAFRAKAVEAHPDKNGGSDAAMSRLNAARDSMLAALDPRTGA